MLYIPTFNDITYTTERLAIYLCFEGLINPYKLLYYLERMVNLNTLTQVNEAYFWLLENLWNTKYR